MQEAPYFRDDTYGAQYDIYSSYMPKDDIKLELQTLFKKFSKCKNVAKNLKNICIQSIVNAGMNIQTDQVPYELIECITQYKMKHRKLFPTFYRVTIMKTKLLRLATYGIRSTIQSEVKNDLANCWMEVGCLPVMGFSISNDWEKRLDKLVTNYIYIPNKSAKKLCHDPNVDLPIKI